MSSPSDYTPPKVWTWNKPNGGQFASINRPIAGPTHEKELPVGRHPLQLYSLGTPNGIKVTIMLEELLALGHSGAEYDAWLIRSARASSSAAASSRSTRTPRSRHCWTAADRRRSGCSKPARSCSISPRSSARSCRPTPRTRRVPVLAVLANGQRALSGRRVRPLLRLCADQDRIRHRSVRDGNEAPARRARPAACRESEYIAGRRLHHRRYGDLALVRRPGERLALRGGEFLSVQDYKNVQRWTDGDRRPAGRDTGTHGQPPAGEPASQLHERHDASDFDTKTQDKIMGAGAHISPGGIAPAA